MRSPFIVWHLNFSQHLSFSTFSQSCLSDYNYRRYFSTGTSRMADVLKTPTKDNHEKITKYFSPTSSPKNGNSNRDLEMTSPFMTPTSTPTKSSKTKQQNSQPDNHVLDGATKRLSEEIKDKMTNSETQVDASQPPTAAASKKTKSGRGRRKKDANTPSQLKPKTAKKKTSEPVSRVLTDFYPVRKSGRRTRKAVKNDKEKELHDAVLSGTEDGIKVQDIEGKGRGVVACKDFARGDFVVEYAGDLISTDEAKKRELKYSHDSNIGCYMYYFNFKNKNYCIDATAESGKLGRLLNHSTKGNCMTKLIGIGDTPYLILVAAKDINTGDELLYDYGDRSPSSIESHPWLKL